MHSVKRTLVFCSLRRSRFRIKRIRIILAYWYLSHSPYPFYQRTLSNLQVVPSLLVCSAVPCPSHCAHYCLCGLVWCTAQYRTSYAYHTGAHTRGFNFRKFLLQLDKSIAYLPLVHPALLTSGKNSQIASTPLTSRKIHFLQRSLPRVNDILTFRNCTRPSSPPQISPHYLFL